MLRLPENLCDWTYISQGHNGVKMHTRLTVVSKDICFPDKIVPSTGKVSDFESSDFLIEEDETTYVMDRGYPSKKNVTDWLNKGISFVTRITKNLVLYTVKKYTPTLPNVVRDEIVNFGISDIPVRYIEFTDDKDRMYRILTTRFDLTDEEILEIYKNRWIIELFFKWIKGHLKFTKIWSTKPQGIWNQMFLALIAYSASLIIKLQIGTSKTIWPFFRLLQTYLYLSRKEFVKELNRKKKKSKGPQKVPIPPTKKEPVYGDVALVRKTKKKK
ncbi:IS4 family transposase [Halobacillus seohaensis]|uniref:IS4 family transposase n=1 Tax=Halobacillus seohaensis TaxID=447421 RepID=A0ABW2ENA8_9BACI